MRAIVVFGLFFILGSCGSVPQLDDRVKRENLLARGLSELQQCNAKYAAGAAPIAVARAQCQNNALNMIRPIYPFPDLLDAYITNRISIAERYRNGKVTLAQANEELIQRRSQMVTEEQRRLLGNPSAAAEEAVRATASLVSGPRVCRKAGNDIVSCF